MHRLYGECISCEEDECAGCPILDVYVSEVYEVFSKDRFNGGYATAELDEPTAFCNSGVKEAKEAKADGGSTPSQYGIPKGAIDLQDLIEYRDMSFSLGNIFKACYRYGKKNDNLYELNKMKWFIDRLVSEEERSND